MELKGSRTEANLMAAIEGESVAHTKYLLYGAVAKQEGYEQIGGIFFETAHNEREHAKLWLRYLHGRNLSNTEENLKDAASGEHFEWTELYRRFAEEARNEGFGEIAAKMELVATIEKGHEKRYNKLIENLQRGVVFEDDEQTVWICRNCGHLHIGKTPPELCPVCAVSRGYFERKSKNY